MPIPTWIRDLLGIRKDIIDTKKSQLEVERLENENKKSSRLITPATLDDVKNFDGKYREIHQRVRSDADKAKRQRQGADPKRIPHESGCLITTLAGMSILLLVLGSILIGLLRH